MPIELERTERTLAALALRPGLADCAMAHWRDSGEMVMASGREDGTRIYLPVGPRTGAMLRHLGRGGSCGVDANLVEQHVEAVEALAGVEGAMLDFNPAGDRAFIRMVAPGIGTATVEIDGTAGMADKLERLLRRSRQDAEGRTLSALGAMSLALAASDGDDLDRIVDTVMTGTDCHYRGVEVEIINQDLARTCVMHKGVAFRSDGIEIRDLPETIKTAIRGRQRRRLSQIVEIAGFDALDVVAITLSATGNRREPGRWIRLDVRDGDGARMPMLETDAVRRVAHETLNARMTA